VKQLAGRKKSSEQMRCELVRRPLHWWLCCEMRISLDHARQIREKVGEVAVEVVELDEEVRKCLRSVVRLMRPLISSLVMERWWAMIGRPAESVAGGALVL